MAVAVKHIPSTSPDQTGGKKECGGPCHGLGVPSPRNRAGRNEQKPLPDYGNHRNAKTPIDEKKNYEVSSKLNRENFKIISIEYLQKR
jgi:hypothetical protein